ncbi:peroxiredoxin-like family protein [Granulosicoccaceae sp. 1_MG-2023]|nr:peroxiredoxin-like family protein [Granulosicoccaceae sp. 1_MG-2023]
MNVLKPREPMPHLTLDTLDGPWTLQEQTPDNFTMMVFYRGLHCPICKTYLKELHRLSADFAERGVNLLAGSSDTQERAQRARDEWELEGLPLAYGLSIDNARALGLHRSAGRGLTSIGIEEPAEFSEPGLFICKPDHTLYFAAISTMPFARPHFREILASMDFALKNNYPARGELS